MFVLRVGSTHRSAFASPTGPGSMQLPARSHQKQMTSASPVGRYCRKFRPCFREELFFDLALEDLTPVGDLFRPIFERPCGVNGGISLEVSPPLAHDTTRRLATAKALDDRAARPTFSSKFPRTSEGLPAIEEVIFVEPLLSREQYVSAAEAWWRGTGR